MLNLRTASLLVLIAAVATVAVAEDWPKWRGPRGDNIASADRLLQQWPDDGPAEVWRVKVGDGYSNPVVADGVIYMLGQEGAKDVLVAISADDHKQLWKRAYPTRFKGGRYPGTRGTPTIDGDRIYTMGGGGDLVCWNRANGDIVWNINVLTATGSKGITWGSACSPLVIGDKVYVQAGKGGPTAVAVSKAKGKILWQSEARTDAGYATIATASPEGRNMLLVFGGVEIIGVDPATGKTLWAVPYETKYRVNGVTPLVRGNQAFISHEYSKPKGTLLQLKPGSATKVWENKTIQSRWVTPILDGDVMYANSKGVIKCVRWADGSEVWACDDGSLNLGIGGAMVRAGELLVVMSDKGKLSLLHATAQAWQLRGQMQLFNESKIWSTPLIYGGRLYVKGGRELVCLDISQAQAE